MCRMRQAGRDPEHVVLAEVEVPAVDAELRTAAHLPDHFVPVVVDSGTGQGGGEAHGRVGANAGWLLVGRRYRPWAGELSGRAHRLSHSARSTNKGKPILQKWCQKSASSFVGCRPVPSEFSRS